jgi:hypothetical protein
MTLSIGANPALRFSGSASQKFAQARAVAAEAAKSAAEKLDQLHRQKAQSWLQSGKYAEIALPETASTEGITYGEVLAQLYDWIHPPAPKKFGIFPGDPITRPLRLSALNEVLCPGAKSAIEALKSDGLIAQNAHQLVTQLMSFTEDYLRFTPAGEKIVAQLQKEHRLAPASRKFEQVRKATAVAQKSAAEQAVKQKAQTWIDSGKAGEIAIPGTDTSEPITYGEVLTGFCALSRPQNAGKTTDDVQEWFFRPSINKRLCRGAYEIIAALDSAGLVDNVRGIDCVHLTPAGQKAVAMLNLPNTAFPKFEQVRKAAEAAILAKIRYKDELALQAAKCWVQSGKAGETAIPATGGAQPLTYGDLLTELDDWMHPLAPPKQQEPVTRPVPLSDIDKILCPGAESAIEALKSDGLIAHKALSVTQLMSFMEDYLRFTPAGEKAVALLKNPLV